MSFSNKKVSVNSQSDSELHINKQSCFTSCSTEPHTELKILNSGILELVWLYRRKNRRKVKLAPQD